MTAIDRARELVADALGLDLEDIGPDATMKSVGDWDSLQHLAVVTAIEADFEIALSPEQVSELNSVAAIAKLIGEHLP